MSEEFCLPKEYLEPFTYQQALELLEEQFDIYGEEGTYQTTEEL